MPLSRYSSGSGSTESNQADRRDYDVSASQSAQDQFNAVAAHLESLIEQRDADVNAAMANYDAEGISEAYAAKEARWHQVGAEVKSIIHTLRSALTSNDETAAQAMQRAQAAVDQVG